MNIKPFKLFLGEIAKSGAHWATPDEIKSGIKSKVVDGVPYVLRVGVEKCGDDDYSARMKWYRARHREARQVLASKAIGEGYKKQYLWIGVVDSHGAVHAERIEMKSAFEEFGETPVHGHFNFPTDFNRWRYPEGSNTVFWYEGENIKQDTIDVVNEFLYNRVGVSGLKHKMVTGEEEDYEDVLYDVMHGLEKLPKQYKLGRRKEGQMRSESVLTLMGESVTKVNDYYKVKEAATLDQLPTNINNEAV
jgi:hypothetical protein